MATTKKPNGRDKTQAEARGHLTSLDGLFRQELVNLLEGKRLLIRALPQIADVAGPRLRRMTRMHTIEAVVHAEQLEALVAGRDGLPLPAKNKATTGMIHEATEVSREEAEGDKRDIRLVSALQRIKHVDLSASGTAAAHAQLLGDERAARALDRLVRDEKRADKQLSDLCYQMAEDEGQDPPRNPFEWEVSQFFQGRSSMPRYRDDDDDRRGPRDRGQPRDEYGQFSSRERSSSRYDDEDDRRYSRSRYDDEDRPRGEGWYRHSNMPDRDEYGPFTSGRGGERRPNSRYDDDDERSFSNRPSRSRYDEDDRSPSRRFGRSRDDEPFGGDEGRREGGYRSSHMQERDEYGQFAGVREGRRSSSRDYDDEDQRGWGRPRGGGGQWQERDEYGQFTSGRGGRSRYDEDDDRGSRSRGSGRDYVDSAGRHYTRESWERAQEGRARGGAHSHGGR